MSMYYVGDFAFDPLYLEHHGILGQKWGIRRYQNSDGSLTEAGRARYYNSDGKWTRAGRRKARKDAKKIVRTAERAVFNKQGKVDKAAESAAQRHSKISVATDYFYGDDDVERRETRATIRNIITNESGKTITEVETYYGKVKKNNFLSKLLYKLDDADYDKAKETEDRRAADSEETSAEERIEKNIKIDWDKKDKSFSDLKKTWSELLKDRDDNPGTPDLDSVKHPFRKKMYELSGNPDRPKEAKGFNFKKAYEAVEKLREQSNGDYWEIESKVDKILAEAIAKDLGYTPTKETVDFFEQIMYSD